MSRFRAKGEQRACAKLTCKAAFLNPPDCDFRYCPTCRRGGSGIGAVTFRPDGRVARSRA